MEIAEGELLQLIGTQTVRLHMQARTIASLQQALKEARQQAQPAPDPEEPAQ